MSVTPVLSCPTCGGSAAPPSGNASFPFCSARCRNVDLARWFGGEYAIDPVTGALDLVDPDEAEDVTELLEH